jgi:hypothetical protein
MDAKDRPMSVQLVPEPVAATIPLVFERPANKRPDTRPVEASGNTGQKQANTADTQSSKAEPSSRPPGKDPSIPPQTIFDASLISAAFKPLTNPEEVAALGHAETTDGTTASGNNDASAPGKDTGTEQNLTPESQTPASDRQLDAQQMAAYTRSGGGSPLTLPASANPNWLSAIEKIA